MFCPAPLHNAWINFSDWLGIGLFTICYHLLCLPWYLYQTRSDACELCLSGNYLAFACWFTVAGMSLVSIYLIDEPYRTPWQPHSCTGWSYGIHVHINDSWSIYNSMFTNYSGKSHHPLAWYYYLVFRLTWLSGVDGQMAYTNTSLIHEAQTTARLPIIYRPKIHHPLVWYYWRSTEVIRNVYTIQHFQLILKTPFFAIGASAKSAIIQ